MTWGSGADISHLCCPPLAHGISLKVPVRSWHCYISNKREWVHLSLWPRVIIPVLCDKCQWLEQWAMLRYWLSLIIVFLPKTMRQAGNNILPILYFYCPNCGGKKDPAAGSILHRKRQILRHAHCALCCLMHRPGLRCDGIIDSNQGSKRSHGHGRVEVNSMVLAFLPFAR